MRIKLNYDRVSHLKIKRFFCKIFGHYFMPAYSYYEREKLQIVLCCSKCRQLDIETYKIKLENYGKKIKGGQ